MSKRTQKISDLENAETVAWNQYRRDSKDSHRSLKVKEALAAVDDLSDGSHHDWRKLAHDLAEALRLSAPKAVSTKPIGFNIKNESDPE